MREKDGPSTGRRVVIVGAGPAGAGVARSLREEGFPGAITLLSDENTVPYDRPPLSKEFLAGEIIESSPELDLLTSDELAGIDFRPGNRAAQLRPADRIVYDVRNIAHHYDDLVIATGTRPRAPQWARGDERAFTVRRLDDVVRLRAAMTDASRVVVVGGGWVGLEAAAVARDVYKLEVDVVEAQRLPLQQSVGPEVAEFMLDQHRSRGVRMRTGQMVTAVSRHGNTRRVELTDGTQIECDLVVYGIGVEPNTSWLQGSGLVLGNGIECSHRFETSLPHVYAVGDVANTYNQIFDEQMRVEHWTTARQQATIVSDQILLGKSDVPNWLPTYWSNQYDMRLQFAGRPAFEGEAEIVWGSMESKQVVIAYEHDGVVSGVLGINAPAQWARSQRHVKARLPWSQRPSTIAS